MFDMDDDKVFFSWCTAVLAVVGTGAAVFAWVTGVPGTKLLLTLTFFVPLVACLFATVRVISELIAYFFPLAVLGICCAYLPVLNWLAGVRDPGDIPPQIFVAWFGETWGQMVIGVLIVLLGYLGLWKARRGPFSG